MHSLNAKLAWRLLQQRRWLITAALLLGASLILSSCGTGSSAEPAAQVINSPGSTNISSGQSSLTSPGVQTTMVPSTTGTPGSSEASVTPADVTLGGVVLTFSLQPPLPAFDPAKTSTSASSDSGGSQQASQSPRGYAILGGSGLRVTNNFDSAQNPPADGPKEILRHVVVQVRDKTSGQLIPYAVVSMDLLRDGRPVLQDQPLPPMLLAGENIAQMHYGNNVKFPGKGDYQIFIRMEPSPLLGPGTSGVAQFNVSIP